MQQKAEEFLDELNLKSKKIFGFTLNIFLSFDLKGTNLIGQCKQTHKGFYTIRLHKPLLLHYKEEYLEDVLVHEFAHAVQMHLYKHKTKPHGRQWQKILEKLTDKPFKQIQKPKYEKLKQLSIKKSYQVYDYTCKCEKIHQLTSIRHKRAEKGTIYICKQCKNPLRYKL